MSQFVRLLQNGIMDSDSDLQAVSQGNYIDALNIRHRDSAGNNMVAISPVNGNDLKVTIPNPALSVAKFRVNLECPAATSADYNGTIYLQNFGTITQNGATVGSSGATTSFTIVDTINDRITTAFPHGFTDGEYVNYTVVTGTATGGLVDTQFYYVRVISPTILELYSKVTYVTSPSPSVTFDPADKINLTSVGTGVQALTAVTLINLYGVVFSTITSLSANLTVSVLYRTSATTGYIEVIKTPATALDNDFSLFSSGNTTTTIGAVDLVSIQTAVTCYGFGSGYTVERVISQVERELEDAPLYRLKDIAEELGLHLEKGFVGFS